MRRPLLFLCVGLFALIAFYMQVYNPPPWEVKPDLRGAEVVLSGRVYDKEYRENEDGDVLILYLKSISTSNSDFQSKEKVRCEILFGALPYLENGNVYLPCLGSVITVRGTWQEFSRATNPGEFDLERYYGVESIVGGVSDGEILEGNTSHWWLREALYQCKMRWINKLYEVFEPKEAAILAKMLLGDGSGLDANVRELYQGAGIAHILSISGLHISMLGTGIYHLLRKCRVGAKGAAFYGGIVIVLYGMMTGFGVSACRAIGMYLIHMLGEIWGKTYDMLTAMGVLCVTMLISNPRLVYHSGYLLSFSSVCGVGLLAPVLQGRFSFLQVRPYEKKWVGWVKKSIKNIVDGVVLSVSVTLFTLPIQLYFFYKVPVYSVILNLLVIPFVSVVMVLGFLIIILPVFPLLICLENGIFAWFEWLCVVFQNIPGHTWLTGKIEMWKVPVYYVALLCLILGAKRLHKAVCYCGLAVLVLFAGMSFRRIPCISFLDVGQGDCAVVETEDGKCFVFDCGSSSKNNVGEKILIPFLQHQGIKEITAIFLSHPDTDHMNGILQLLEERDVKLGKVFLPDYEGAKESFSVIFEYVPAIRVDYVSAGMHMEEEDFRLTCLYPEKEYRAMDDNEASACYLLEMSDMSVLFTGDLTEEREEALLEEWRRQGRVSVDILKVAHHGSRFSTSSDFLEMIRPEMAVVSCGKNNLYGHPHEETLQRLEDVGSEVHVTARQGAVIIPCNQ